MKNTLLTIALIFFALNAFSQTSFQVLYPSNNSITNPVIMSNYNDTANGKIIMNGWPYNGNFIINSVNISNNNYPCGRSFPFPSSKMIYLNQLYTSGNSNALCYASGPMPDTILYFLANPIDTFFTDSMYFVVGGSFPANVEDYHKLNLELFPNPAYESITIKNIHSNTNVLVYNMNGKAILKEQISEYQTTIDISTLSHGFYIIQTSDQNGIIRRGKFLKQ